MPIVNKKCSKCHIEKSLDNFDKTKKIKSGLRSECKQCRSNYARNYRINNKEAMAIKNKRACDWQKENRQRRREYNRAWYKKNKDKAKHYHYRWRTKLNYASDETKQYIKILMNDPCAYCGIKENFNLEHILPLSKGGIHDYENLTSSCEWCNKSKKDKSLLFYLLGAVTLCAR